MKTIPERVISLGILPFVILLLSSCGKSEDSLVLTSPDGSIQFSFYLDDQSSACYDLYYHDSLIIGHASLGLELKEGGGSGSKVRIKTYRTGETDESWSPVYGERSEIRNRFKSMQVNLADADSGSEKMTLEVRAYNEGIVFRYHLPGEEKMHVLRENTRFSFGKEVQAWVSHRAQSPIYKTGLGSVVKECERPLLIEYDRDCYLALGEAGLVDFARMKFRVDSLQECTLLSSLSGEVISDKKLKTPWRYIMLGTSPSEILQNNFLLENLNEPNQIEDPSWIRPGKVIREVTLTTIGGKACVDFAVRNGLQFVEFDAGWYGNEYDETSDATTISVDPKRSPGPLDLQEVIRYAEKRGIGIILYVNRRALEKQLDEILPLYKSWGVAGVKYGFVRVGSQEWTTWLHEAVRKAAENGLMVDIHDEYRPTGFSRTYPNLMTQEGIRGDEESPPNEMVINTLFTRMIAGAGDQTNCYFADRVTEKMGSHVSQMAKAICIYSPWQFLYWYDRPAGSPGKKGGAGGAEGSIPELADLQFYAQLPTVWDETLVLDGYPGSHAILARRLGESWFVGALNGKEARQFEIALDFLNNNEAYTASIYTDDAEMGTRTNVALETSKANSRTVITRELQSRNGLALILHPAD